MLADKKTACNTN